MGRSRAAPASKPTSAPRASAPPPARTAAPQQQQQHSNNNTNQQQAPQTTHVIHHHQAPMSGGGMGGGMMGGMMGTMAAVAAGSVAGNYISNSLFSNSNGHQMQPGEQPPQQFQNPQEANALAQQAQQQQDPCKAYFETYAKCLEVQQTGANGLVGEGGLASCQWSWDLILKCRQQAGL